MLLRIAARKIVSQQRFQIHTKNSTASTGSESAISVSLLRNHHSQCVPSSSTSCTFPSTLPPLSSSTGPLPFMETLTITKPNKNDNVNKTSKRNGLTNDQQLFRESQLPLLNLFADPSRLRRSPNMLFELSSEDSLVPAIDRLGLANENGLLDKPSVELPTTNPGIVLELPYSNPNRPRLVYTFPTAPGVERQQPHVPFLEIPQIIDPLIPGLQRIRIEDPVVGGTVEKMAKKGVGSGSKRMLIIRRRKVKLMKRKKRRRKNNYQIVNRQIRKKNLAEKNFRIKISQLLVEAVNFDAETYVKETLDKAKKPKPELTHAGRKKHPHWRELMEIEELYGVPKSDYIDKKAGLPDGEELEELNQILHNYRNRKSKIN